MKTKLITTLTLLLFAGVALAEPEHHGVELGPNGGRILEFSKNETMHGEVVLHKDKFHITLLDKDMKPVAMDRQILAATTGERSNPTKLVVEKDAKGFLVPSVKDGEWLILQYKNTPDSKAITARLLFDTGICEPCKNPEWLCKCKPEAEKK